MISRFLIVTAVAGGGFGTYYIVSRITDPSWQFRDIVRKKIDDPQGAEWVCGLTSDRNWVDVWICNLWVSLSSIGSSGSNEKLIQFPEEIIAKKTSRKIYITDKDKPNKLWYMSGNSGPLGLLKLTKSNNSKPEITFCKKKVKEECKGQSPCSPTPTCDSVSKRKKETGREMTRDKYRTALWKIGYLRPENI